MVDKQVRKFGTPEGLQLMPCAPDVCQECARPHAPEEPHDATSLYYHVKFYGEHGRWPTWKDATSHCKPEIRDAWKSALQERGLWPEEEGDRG